MADVSVAPAPAAVPSQTPSVQPVAPATAKALAAKIGLQPQAEKPPDETAETKAVERKAANIARVKREQAALFKQREEIKAQQASWMNAQREVLQRAKQYDDLQNLAKTDPRKFLDAAGVKFEDVAKQVIKGDTRSPEEIAEAIVAKRFAELDLKRAELDRQSKAAADAQNTKAAIQSAQDSMAQIAKDGGDAYEFVNSTPGAIAKAWEVIEAYAEMNYDAATGRVRMENPQALMKEALELIEKDLEAKSLVTYKSSKKLKAALEREAAAEKEAKLKAEQDAKTNRFRVAPRTNVAAPSVEGQPAPAQTPKRQFSRYDAQRENIRQRVAERLKGLATK